MVAIRVKAHIGEDRRLVIELPKDTPTGEVEVIIQPEAARAPDKQAVTNPNPAREAVRAKLLAGGALRTEFNFDLPPDYVPLSPEELLRIGTLPEGARSSLDLINEDRGEW